MVSRLCSRGAEILRGNPSPLGGVKVRPSYAALRGNPPGAPLRAHQKGSKKGQNPFFRRCRAIFWVRGRPCGAPLTRKVTRKAPPFRGGGKSAPHWSRGHVREQSLFHFGKTLRFGPPLGGGGAFRITFRITFRVRGAPQGRPRTQKIARQRVKNCF